MSPERQSLAEAFRPASARGASLEGLLPPKRRRTPAEPQQPAAQAPETPELPPTTPQRTVQVPPGEQKEHTPAGPGEGAPKTAKQNRNERRPATAPSREAALAAAPTTDRKPTPDSAPHHAAGPRDTEATSTTVAGGTRNVGVYLPPELLAAVQNAVRQQRITYADLLVDAFDGIDGGALEEHFNPRRANTSSMPRRIRRPRGTAGIQIQVRLDDLQLGWLSEQVERLHAPSRSALVSAAYQLYLFGEL
ncbi:MAG: hypothetical protein JWP57_4483 [Spirosoma sp.]|nr:hypothetical protein [Spirosoma sp.]